MSLVVWDNSSEANKIKQLDLMTKPGNFKQLEDGSNCTK